MQCMIAMGLSTMILLWINLLSLGRKVLTCLVALMTMTVIGRLLFTSISCEARMSDLVLKFLTL